MIIVGEVVLLKLDPTEVARSLMTDSVLFILGSLMLAVAVVETAPRQTYCLVDRAQ